MIFSLGWANAASPVKREGDSGEEGGGGSDDPGSFHKSAAQVIERVIVGNWAIGLGGVGSAFRMFQVNMVPDQFPQPVSKGFGLIGAGVKFSIDIAQVARQARGLRRHVPFIRSHSGKLRLWAGFEGRNNGPFCIYPGHDPNDVGR